MEIKIDEVKSLISILSWKKIFQLSVLIIVLITSYGFWENRVIIYNSLRIGLKVEVDDAIVFRLSVPTIQLLESTNQKTKSLIGGIQLSNVSFRKNIRSIAYLTSTDENLKKSYNDYLLRRISSSPLFTSNEMNNQSIIDLINGEFVCNKFDDVNVYRTFEGAGSTITHSCSITVPPYYGRFTGFMTIYLTREPTADEFIFIRQVARELSTVVFENDVNKSDQYPTGRIK